MQLHHLSCLVTWTDWPTPIALSSSPSISQGWRSSTCFTDWYSSLMERWEVAILVMMIWRDRGSGPKSIGEWERRSKDILLGRMVALQPCHNFWQVAYHGVPEKAYEVFVTALKAHYLERGLVIPELEDQNPAGQYSKICRYICSCWVQWRTYLDL